MTFQELTDRREDLLKRLKAAVAKDCSCAHNDELVGNLERELENLEHLFIDWANDNAELQRARGE